VTGKVGITGRVAIGPTTIIGVEVGTAVDDEPQAASVKARDQGSCYEIETV
jgi:hypothetical protein